jgi:hypothetical protein
MSDLIALIRDSRGRTANVTPPNGASGSTGSREQRVLARTALLDAMRGLRS